MAETERITVAEVSEGFGSVGKPGSEVSLPVVELLTGRGFATGKSGAGKSNSVSVIAEKLLDNGFGLLIVDVDGEYYGLKEEYELLHVGADEECDIQVTPDHAEKLATLALERNVPIILDVSSYLEESEAEAVLTAVARHLFAKAKKQKQPFLVVVEEIHEYIPEKGSVGNAGQMLIKIGKRGRKHGLGIVGISQRPADVKKDFITQCDWLLWHRLTWDNDTNVVGRMLDGEYASAVEDLADGEGFLMTDWAETERVQFYRKRTFDAGATPGLEDFERPELKSVSEELVAELKEPAEEDEDDRIAELRAELDEKNSRIAELERELQDARDLRRLAEEFVDALVQGVEGPAPGRTERERMRGPPRPTPAGDSASGPAIGAGALANAGEGGVDAGTTAASPPVEPEPDGGNAPSSGDDQEPADDTEAETAEESGEEAGDGDTDDPADAFSAAAILETLNAASDLSIEDIERRGPQSPRERVETGRTESQSNEPTDRTDDPEGRPADGEDREEPVAVRELKAEIAGLETLTREMLSVYRKNGPMDPQEAHVTAGGDGDRTRSYARNRALRTRGLIEHVGRGYYDDALRAALTEKLPPGSHDRVEKYLGEIDRATVGET